MAALSNVPPKKDRTMLYIGIIAVIAIAIIVGAVLTYLYFDDQDRQNKNRERLKQAFSDQLNATNASYAYVMAYPAAPNKNYVEDFRAWIDGYRQRVADYSHTVDTLLYNGTELKMVVAADSSDSANVTQACNRANDTVRSLNDSIQRIETEYLSYVALKDNASKDYRMALERSAGFYSAAWDQMHNETTYIGSGFYHNFLKACEQNITYYNQSIPLAQSYGCIYQNYLKGDDYYAVNATIDAMHGNVTKLKARYNELLKHIPNATVNLMDLNTAINEKGQFQKVQNFQVINNDFPMLISDVVVRFQLINRATGAVRSTADVPVEMAPGIGYSRYIYQAVLLCDEGGDYDIRYTITYEY
ncbi:MAG: hypothetical protein A4E28_00179 [Methanocella sp. PtaU1.Bin125]|nr:MAG: hypothetical protein A4E28_00179 [Methanocella sp. PtaU1.Bin125]